MLIWKKEFIKYCKIQDFFRTSVYFRTFLLPLWNINHGKLFWNKFLRLFFQFWPCFQVSKTNYFIAFQWDSIGNHAERSRRVRGYVHPEKVVRQFSPSIIFQKRTILKFNYYFSSASNRIIAAKDHASIQMNIVDVDETTGRMTSTFKTYAICGQIRRMGESDDCINRLAKKDGIISKNF